MALDNILAISKKPGLYKLINPSRGGYIVESFLDQKRTFVKARANDHKKLHQWSLLHTVKPKLARCN